MLSCRAKLKVKDKLINTLILIIIKKNSGIPEPEVYWISPTEEIFAQGQKEGKHVASRGKMHIKASTLRDSGWWWCVAKSSVYFEYLPIRLTVLPRYSRTSLCGDLKAPKCR